MRRFQRQILLALGILFLCFYVSPVIAADNPALRQIDAILPLNLKQYSSALNEEKKFAALVRAASYKATGDPLLYQSYQSMRALKTNPNDFDANLQICDAYFKTGFMAAAAKQCREVLKINPSSALAKTRLADLAFRAGKNAAAKNILSDVVKDNPQFSAANLLLAEIAKSEGQTAVAANQIQQAVNSSPDEASLLAMGDLMLQNGQSDQASNSYLKVLQINPQNTAALSRLADLFAGKGDYTRALDFAEKAAASDRTSALAQFTLGTQYANSNRIPESIVSFAAATRLDPQFGLAHRALGEALIKNNAPIDAIASLNKALQFMPNDAAAETAIARAYAMTGTPYASGVDRTTNQAEVKDNRPALPTTPKDNYKIKQLQSRAQNAESQKQYESARQSYEQLAILQPERADHFYNIARIYMIAQQWDLSARFYNLALERDPSHAPSLAGQARLSCFRGNTGDAWQNYSRAKSAGFIDNDLKTQQYLNNNCPKPQSTNVQSNAQ